MDLKAHEIDHLIETHGERWILRDLDLFPEKLSDIWVNIPVYRSHSFLDNIYNGSQDNNWAVYKTKKDALQASMKARHALGLKDSPSLMAQLSQIEETEALISRLKEFKKEIKTTFGKDIEIKIPD